jgi:membrane-associated phospholipid phosphatase
MAPGSGASPVVQQDAPSGTSALVVGAAVLPARWRAAAVFLGQLAPIFGAGILYELLRGVFQYRGTVHVGDLFEYEARLFSINTADGPRALSEVVSRHTSPWLDLVCGITYFVFLAEVLGVASYLFFRARAKTLHLSVGFLVVNLLGWAIWLVYPAAPPWYVDTYGTGPVLLDVVSSPAGLARLDAWIGLPLATNFYSQSANVFGAVPSLHVAYAVLVAWVSYSVGGWLRGATIAFAISMAFSAVYLRHHYLIDVVAGALLALLVGFVIGALQRPAWRRVGRAGLENAHES